ncbi:MAG TPA: hypothetical protein VNL39_05030 [Xanthobacteraceae bacterium]|nr:hypothetical protein [Xanthobacteraceae bacterium]
MTAACGSQRRLVPLACAGHKLQLPQSPARAPFVKASVRVRQYPDGTLDLCHGPQRLARYDAEGQLIEDLP